MYESSFSRRSPLFAAVSITAALSMACEGPGGSDGATGPAGPAGTVGNPGATGPAGMNGVDGATGPTGEGGPGGATGPTGTTGPTGSNGTNGTGNGHQAPWLTDGGLAVAITGAGIGTNGTATVSVTVTDGAGTPIDVNGLLTEGSVSLRFILTRLDTFDDGAPKAYTAYTTRTQTSTSGDSATQAATDSGGTLSRIADGEYHYTFGATATGFDAGGTHAIGLYATRTVDGVRAVSNAVHHFVPDGSSAPQQRQVVTEAACTNCHAEISAHGGARVGVDMCVLCHSAQTSDPDSGNTVDMRVMIHKIHRGEDLPSVSAGDSYQIIGYRSSVHDYSHVKFPRDIRECEVCHDGPQGSNYGDRPAIDACVSCHDRLTFSDPPEAGFTPHTPPIPPTLACSTCHELDTGLLPIRPRHYTGTLDSARPTVALAIEGVTDSAPGETPTMTFTVMSDGAARDIVAEPLDSLRAILAGPNTDYTAYESNTIQGGGASGTLVPVDAAAGRFAYTFANAIPANATGSWTVSLEGYLRPGGTGPRFAARNPSFAFAVTDATAVARRTIVTTEACLSCHGEIGAHGGQRHDVAHCATCHNPSNVGDERASRLEGATIMLESVDLRVMIHKIHMGHRLSQPYLLGGFPPPSESNPAGNQHDFGAVLFPNNVADCRVCHEGATYRLPIAAGAADTILEERTCTEDPAADTDALCDVAQWTVTNTIVLRPETAVCTSCHDSPSARAHAVINTTSDGAEACATCHGEGKSQSVDVVHGL